MLGFASSLSSTLLTNKPIKKSYIINQRLIPRLKSDRAGRLATLTAVDTEKDRESTMNFEKASDSEAGSKEARTAHLSSTAGNPQYPSGATLYLVMMALMLSMFLVGRQPTT